MRAYNIYFNNEKINSTPLTRDDIQIIKSNKFINKKIDDNTIKKISVKDITIVECTVI